MEYIGYILLGIAIIAVICFVRFCVRMNKKINKDIVQHKKD
jgi:hypothetical protein